MRLNEMDDDEARAALRSCCASTTWIERMMLARPFGDVPAVLDAADRTLAEISEDLGAPMTGINIDDLIPAERLASRGW